MKSIFLLFILLTFSINVFSQQLMGKIIDENGKGLSSVIIKNRKTDKDSYSDSFGNFSIEVNENDEIRFVKDNYYRTDRKVTKDNLLHGMSVLLLSNEKLIPEVVIERKLTGNLALDSKRYGEAKRLTELKSLLSNYMMGPMTEPLPTNELPKTFAGHDFKAGQVDLFGAFNVIKGMIKKAKQPKITKPNYIETQNFMKELRVKVNLNFLKEAGMTEEQTEHFLLYANDTHQLAKKYRKTFDLKEIESELRTALRQYSKTNKIGE